MSIEPGRAIGGYEIIGLVGEGGMGTVYKAYQRALGRYVAIKVINPGQTEEPGFKERFVTEGLAIARLRHPNIVSAFDFAQDAGVAYLVSEFVDGGTLADQIGRPLPLDYVIRMLSPLASALDYAHARGVLHRDIKPANVLVQRDGTPVLTDFGLARISGPVSGVTRANAPMGTVEYMSPEAASGNEIGPAADLYALAIVAYEMLTGRTPFAGDTPIAVLLAQISKQPPAPSELGVPLAPGAEEALMRALRKEPEERFPGASDFIRALQAPAPAPVAVPAERAAAAATSTAPRRPLHRFRSARWLAFPVVALVALVAVGSWLRPSEPAATPSELATLRSTRGPISLQRGAQGECLVAYYNAGSNAWVKGSPSEVVLVLDTDAVPTALQAWVTDLGGGVVATQRADSVDPGRSGAFSITIVVPEESTEQQAGLLVYPMQNRARIGQSAECLVSAR